ncbi:MAG: hypothetical protein LBQ66_12780 [Planctomycetaceae bacterium]|nr:hypothetical protein [Planctomycetaceae bacterium]
MNRHSQNICSPIRLGVPSKLVWFCNTQRRAGCPRTSPCRFAAIIGCADAGGFVYFIFFVFSKKNTTVRRVCEKLRKV